MESEDRKPLGYGLFSLASTVAATVAPMAYPSLAPLLIEVIWWGGITAMSICAIWLTAENMKRKERVLPVVVMIISAIGFVFGLVWLLQSKSVNGISPIIPPVQTDTQRSMFSASENSKIDAKNLKILSDIQGLSIANATKGPSINIDGMTIASNVSFPIPQPAARNISNSDLKSAAKALSLQFHQNQQDHENDLKRLEDQGISPSDFKARLALVNDAFKAKYQETTLKLAAAILYRLPSGQPPERNLTNDYVNSIEGMSAKARRGKRVLLLSGITPSEGDVVADFWKRYLKNCRFRDLTNALHHLRRRDHAIRNVPQTSS